MIQGLIALILTVQAHLPTAELRTRAIAYARETYSRAGGEPSTLVITKEYVVESRPDLYALDFGETAHVVLDLKTMAILSIQCDRGPNPVTYSGDVRSELEAICQRELNRMGGSGRVTIDEDTVMELEDQAGPGQHTLRATVHVWPAPGIRELPGLSWDIDGLTSYPYFVNRLPEVRLPQNLTPAVTYDQAVQLLAQRYLSLHPSAQLERTYIRSMVMINPRLDGCPIQPEPESFRLAKSRDEGWLAYDVTFNLWHEGRLVGHVWGRMDAMSPNCMAVDAGGGIGAIKSPAKAPPKPWAKSKTWTVSLGRLTRKTTGTISVVTSEPKKYVSDARILITNDSGAMWLANYSIKQNVLFWADGKTALQCVPPLPIKNSILKLIQSSK